MASSKQPNYRLRGFLLVAFSGILSGTIVFSGKVFSNWGLSLFEISTLPFIFTLFFLLPFVLQKKHFPKKKDFPLLFLYGAVAAGSVLTEFGGVVFGASVAVVVLLLYTQPLWTVLISRLILKESVNRWQALACVLVLIGVFFLVDPAGLFAPQPWLGVLSALIGGIFLSLWIIVGARASKKGIPPASIKFFETLIGLIITFAAFPLFLFFTSAPSVVDFSLNWPLWLWGVLILYNLVSYTGNHLIYYAGSKLISTVNAGILMLLEPVVGVILAALFLTQLVTFSVLVGGALILAANYLVVSKG